MGHAPFFMTEKETEEWLVHETRELPWPGRPHRPVTTSRLVWRAFDFLVDEQGRTEVDIVEIAIDNAREMSIQFERSFDAVVGFLADPDALSKL